LNSQVRIQDRLGHPQHVNLSVFWAPVAARRRRSIRRCSTFVRRPLDLHVRADAFRPSSSVLIGVTQTGDPTGNWFLYRVDAIRQHQLGRLSEHWF